MKKFIYSILAISIALATSSCTKEQETISLDEMDFSTITASSRMTKTSVDGVHVLFNNGESVQVYHKKTSDETYHKGKGVKYTTDITTPSSTAVFNLVPGQEVEPYAIDGKYWAAFPYEATTGWSKFEGQNIIQFQMTGTEKVSGPGVLPDNCAMMLASASDLSFKFQHLMGYISFTIGKDSPSIVSVSVKNKNSGYLAGYYDYNVVDGTYAFRSASANTNVVTLSKADGSVMEPGTYYIAIVPGSFMDGLEFTFTNSDNQPAVKSFDKTLHLTPGQVQNIGTVSNLSFAGALPKLGDIYQENGKNAGVICYVNEAQKYALVISHDEYKGAFSDVSLKDKFIGLESNSGKSSGADMTKKVIDYYNSTVKADNPDLTLDAAYPAIAFCVNKGEGWFIPGYQVEWKALFSAYDLTKAEAQEALNARLIAAGGTALQNNTFYWCSSEKSESEPKAGAVRFDSTASATKSDYYAKNGDRPARAFKKINF